MFERFTEQALRTVFFARYKASELGGTSIETEHLLLGAIQESPGLLSRWLPNVDASERLPEELTAAASRRQGAGAAPTVEE